MTRLFVSMFVCTKVLYIDFASKNEECPDAGASGLL